MTRKIVPYSIGCEPSPSAPAETLLQDGWTTLLLFFAVSEEVQAPGHLNDLGVAVLECMDCAATKFGYPNDEGIPEHPLYRNGLSDASSAVLELVDSGWAEEMMEMMRESARRIRGSSATHQVANLRHFVICFKELTFECLASELVVRHYARDFSEGFRYVRARFSGH